MKTRYKAFYGLLWHGPPYRPLAVPWHDCAHRIRNFRYFGNYVQINFAPHWRPHPAGLRMSIDFAYARALRNSLACKAGFGISCKGDARNRVNVDFPYAMRENPEACTILAQI